MTFSKPVSSGQIVWVVIVAVVLIASIIALSIYSYNKNADDDSALNKDVALGSLFEKDEIVGIYDHKNIILTNNELFSSMLRSSEWKYLPGYTGNIREKLVFIIDAGYDIVLSDDNLAVVRKGDESRFYRTPSGIVSELAVFIKDTVFISRDDASAFLSVSGNINITVQGATKTVSSGAQLASALNIPAWTEYSGVIPEFEPAFSVDNRNGLKISVYKAINIGVIDFNGTDTVYSVDELSIASAEVVAKSYFNDAAATLEEKMTGVDSVTVVKSGTEYQLSPDTSIDKLLDTSKWERRFKAPAGLPSKPDISVNGGSSFTLNLYSALSVAELGNVYYSVPSTVFSAVDNYLRNDDESPETVTTLKTTVSSGISEKKQINIQYKGSGYIVSVSPEFLSVLSITSWNESPVLELMGEPDLVLDINKIPALSLSFYSVKNSVSVVSGNDRQVYKISPSVYESLISYIQDNLYTEAWAVSATELGALQKNAESVDVTITDRSSYSEKYSSDTEDALSVLAAVDLLPYDVVPEITAPEKTEILFKGSEKFIMTLYPAEDGSTFVNVTGTFYSRGKYIDRWFTCGSPYADVVASIKDVNARASDTVAALFCESLRTGDIDSIYRLIGTSAFDYSGIKTLMLNNLTISGASGNGIYTINLNVEDPVDSPFEKGIGDYILVVGSSEGSISVVSFMRADEYELLNSSDAAVAAADSFTSWIDAAGLSFGSAKDIDNRSAVASYLMLLCKRDGKGSVSADNPSLIFFTQDEINDTAAKYFGIDSYEATDIAAYDSETGLYSYEGRSTQSRYKRAVAVTHDEAGNATVTYKWYSDPLYLYDNAKVVYTLRKNNDGTYALLSASADQNPDQNEPDQPSEQEPAAEDPSDPSGQTDEEPSEEEPGTEDVSAFTPPAGLSTTETMFKYYEYLNEKDPVKANSIVYEAYMRSDTEYDFENLVKLSVLSCAEVPSDFDWYEPWYRSPAAYACVVAEINVDCSNEKYLVYSKGQNSVEIYMIKETEDSDWRVIAEKKGGEGILSADLD